MLKQLESMSKKEKIEKGVKWGLGLGAVAIGGLAAMWLIQSAILLAILGVILLGIVNFAPVIASKFATWKLKAIKHDASTNPVENLQQVWMKKHQQLFESAEAVTAFSTQTKSFGDKLENFKQRRPHKAAEFQKTYDNMNRVLQLRLSKLTQARNKLEEFQHVIEEAQDVWDMTQEAIKANAAMSKFDQLDPMDEIRTKTAVDAVQDSLNQVMAELETSLALDYNAIEQNEATFTKLEASTPEVLEMDTTNLTIEPIKVRSTARSA